jgi:hypothetical protein
VLFSFRFRFCFSFLFVGLCFEAEAAALLTAFAFYNGPRAAFASTRKTWRFALTLERWDGACEHSINQRNEGSRYLFDRGID